MEIRILPSYDELSLAAAVVVRNTLNSKPNAVLGLATGSTPLGLYKALVKMHQEEGLDFSQVTTFNLDEYVGLSKGDKRSYHYFMHEHLFRHINISPQNIYIPSGTTDNYQAFCDWYEQRIVDCGGIDLQILGIGSDGHIAFNEPTSSLGSRTRIKTLARQTIADNARFFERSEDVPVYAITMGVGTIMEARKIILLASGKNKASAVAAAIEGPVTSMITASVLQLHRDVTCYVEPTAASSLKMTEYYQWVDEHRPHAPTPLPHPHWQLNAIKKRGAERNSSTNS